MQFVQDFLDAIQRGTEPMITGRDMLRVLRVLDAAYESNKTGRHVQIE